MSYPILQSRRLFLTSASAVALAIGLPEAFAQTSPKTETTPTNSPLESEKVQRFLRAAHSDVVTIRSMLAETPALANSCWDWGNGDFENAINAPSHMGNHEIANVLIDAGARPDIFYYVMRGELNIVRSIVSIYPRHIQQVGPHGMSLIYHTAISGNVDLAKFLTSQGATVDSRSLTASVIIGKNYEMTEWLLQNGAVYDAKLGRKGKTLAQEARENDQNKLAALLEKHQR